MVQKTCLAFERVLPMVPWKVDGLEDWMVHVMVVMTDAWRVVWMVQKTRLACERVLPMVSGKVDGLDDWMVYVMLAMTEPLKVDQKAPY